MRKSFAGNCNILVIFLGLIILMAPGIVCAEENVDLTQAASIVEADELIEDLDSEEGPENDAEERFRTKRLIVLASGLEETYGAVSEWRTAEDEIVLEYSTIEETRVAFEKLSDEYRCYPDEVLHVVTDGDSDFISLGMGTLKNAPLGRDVTVAVLDTGIDASRSWFDKGSESGGRISDSSYDFVHDTADLSDSEGHGTNVSGVIAANTPDNVTILSCTVLGRQDDDSDTKLSTLLLVGSALRYAIANGADVINMSFELESESGSIGSQDYLNDILENAYSNGVICTVASGNDGRQLDNSNYPACVGSVVTVGSVNENNELSEFSNYGKKLDFAAPGEFGEIKGTSFAAPCIAACFAYLKGQDPEASAFELINKLCGLCTDPGEPGRDDKFGWGIPDMSKLERAEEHHYIKTVVKAATCVEDGLARYECSDCGDSYERVIPKTGHTWTAVADGGIHLECQNRGCSAVISQDDLSGTIGNNIEWKIINSGTNNSGIPVATLEIRGSGEIPAADEYPWTLFSDYITTVVFSEDITALPANSFAGMRSLVSIEYTDDMEDGRRYSGFSPKLSMIGSRAFFDCDALRTISIGAGIGQIYAGAFAGCDNLTQVSVDSENRNFKAENGQLYRYGTQLVLYTGSSEISDRTQYIDDYAFCGRDITSIDIPKSVLQIGSSAFQGCHELRSITFNESPQISIAEDSFKDVKADVYYPEAVADAGWINKDYGGKLRWNRANLHEGSAELELQKTDYTYTGEPIIPEVTVKLISDGTLLEEGKDYRVVCSNNVDPGEAEVKIIGTDNGYSGMISGTFTIAKAEFNFRKLEVPETVNAGEEISVKYEGRLIKDIPELEIHYGSDPEEMFCTEEDSEGSYILVARRHGTGTLVVTANGNKYYEADRVKEYKVNVLPCADDEHEWDQGTVVKEATETDTGLKRHTCIKCGETKDEIIDKLPGAAVGTSHKIGKFTYKVKSTNSVELTKAPNIRTVKVPDTVTINGKKYTVSSIGSKALYKKSKLKKLTIGSKVSTIGVNACAGCRKLKTIRIKGKALKKIGKNAFRNIHAKATAKAPKAKVKAYRKMLKKAGMKGRKQKVVA